MIFWWWLLYSPSVSFYDIGLWKSNNNLSEVAQRDFLRSTSLLFSWWISVLSEKIRCIFYPAKHYSDFWGFKSLWYFSYNYFVSYLRLDVERMFNFQEIFSTIKKLMTWLPVWYNLTSLKPSFTPQLGNLGALVFFFFFQMLPNFFWLSLTWVNCEFFSDKSVGFNIMKSFLNVVHNFSCWSFLTPFKCFARRMVIFILAFSNPPFSHVSPFFFSWSR